MSIRLSTFAIALVVLANALILAGVAWNRSGEPTAVLEVTERELALPYGRWGGRESTGVSLSIRRADQDYPWLDRDKLEELGFDVDRYAHRPRGEWRASERRAYVVLEYDGPAFRRLVSEQQERLAAHRAGLETGETNHRQVEAAQTALKRLETAESRLVVVDAGRDPEALRDRYPDQRRYAVMLARLHMRAIGLPGEDATPQLRGRVGALLPGRVFVPRRFHAPLRQATGEARSAYDEPPRYRVTVKLGRSGEPWMAGVEPMAESGG